MKNIARNKLLLCFRPVMNIEAALESERHDYIHSPSCDSVTFRSAHNKMIGMKAATSPDSGFSTYSGESAIIPPSKPSFFRAVKATIFASATVLKMRENQQESTRSKRGSSMDLERKPLMGLSDSSPSILSAETKKEGKPHRVLTPNKRNIEMGGSNIEDGLCLLLISLVITVWLGRLFAIILTLVWLYSVPRKTLRDQSTKLAPAETRKETKSFITERKCLESKTICRRNSSFVNIVVSR